ncbi:MAG: ComF family protein [Bacillota bacterium]|nr:ComF family protein [Bacillota bacterium]
MNPLWQAAREELLALLYPDAGRCALCGGPLSGATSRPEEGDCRRLAAVPAELPPLCRACLDAIPREEEVCPRCGRPAAGAAARGELCPECAAHPPVAARLRCIGVYQGSLRGAVLALKHSGRTDLARILGTLMALRLREGLGAPDLVVPLPASPGGLRHRGYNQAELLARVVAAPWGLPVRSLLRTRDAASQEGRGREHRRFARAGGFLVEEDITGARLLLVDDLYATRATLDAAAEALYAAGAGRVEAVVAAAPLYTGSR